MSPPTLCLSVVMPAFNEGTTLEAVIHKVLSRPETGQLIVVDDASTDSTPDIL
ncbi:MAG: glycosyltransferase, partial [Verrucomicrobia bacterium]|nr:glycosyltransferase [Verrucomicrobiota bacterium]